MLRVGKSLAKLYRDILKSDMHFSIFITIALLTSQTIAISYDQFCQAADAYSATGNGTPPKPSQDVYNAYVKAAKDMPVEEQAWLLANCAWESAGFQRIEEDICKGKETCADYGKYFGRGYIQLTHDYNYKAASKAITGSESTFLDKPSLVATNDYAWATTIWFWNNNVHAEIVKKKAIEGGLFGVTIGVINSMECPGNDKAQNRVKIVNKIYEAWKLTAKKPTIDGCAKPSA